jgi:hypothetical protein
MATTPAVANAISTNERVVIGEHRWLSGVPRPSRSRDLLLVVANAVLQVHLRTKSSARGSDIAALGALPGGSQCFRYGSFLDVAIPTDAIKDHRVGIHMD